MARVPAWTSGTNIWGDKTLQASAFADDPNSHVNPVAADLDWNSLRADYISQTDSTAQTIASILGLGALGSTANDLVRISPITGWAPTSPAIMVDLNPNSFAIPSNNFSLFFLRAANTLVYGTTTGGSVQGLIFSPTISLSAGGTITTAIGANLSIGFAGGFAGTITNLFTANVTTSLNAGGTYTTVKGVNSSVVPAGTVTTAVALDVLMGTGGAVTNRIALRDTSSNASVTSRLNSLLRLGDQTAPIMQTEINGGLGVKVNTQTVSYTALLSDHYILGDATTAAITITLPTSAGSFNGGVSQRLQIKKKDSSVNTVTIAGNGADTIQGAATVVLSAQYNSRTLYTDGSGVWYIEAST